MAKKTSRFNPQAGALKKKEEARKLAARQAAYQEKKRDIWTIAIIVMVAIILLTVAFDYFYAPAGSMRVFMGKLQGVEENAIIKQLGNERYYTFGWMETPEGYTPGEFLVSTVPQVGQDFYYLSDDETRAIKSVYVSGVADKNSTEMIDLVEGLALYTEMEILGKATLGGHEVEYFYAMDVSENEETKGQAYASLVLYVNSVQDSSIVVNCATAYDYSLDNLPTKEDMLAEIEPILAKLTVAK